MKKIIWLLIVIIIAAVAYKFIFPTGGEMLEGTVISVNTEQVALDGPSIITVDTEAGERQIAVPSMGINLCAARDNIADPYEITAGEVVSVKGEADEEGRIVPCEDESHYLRVQ